AHLGDARRAHRPPPRPVRRRRRPREAPRTVLRRGSRPCPLTCSVNVTTPKLPSPAHVLPMRGLGRDAGSRAQRPCDSFDRGCSSSVHLAPAGRTPGLPTVEHGHRGSRALRRQDGINVKLAGSRRLAGIAAMSALALTLAACGNGDNGEDDATNGSDTDTTETEDGNDDSEDTGSSELSGDIAGSGASSQEAAVQGWIAGFMEQNPD